MRSDISLLDLASQQRRLGGAIERAVQRVFDHGQYILGPEVRELEERLADFAGVRHVITCASGTDALLLSLLAWGVGPGDAVVVPTFTFAATAEVVALVGATPVFADASLMNFNVDPASVECAIAAARAKELRVAGIIAVDLFGLPADYAALSNIALAEHCWVLADAAQSFGAEIGGRRSGQLGTASATSFFPAKPLGCYGDGGAVLVDDDETAATLRSLRVHGQGKNKYENIRVGINGRLDTIQAAILLEKLSIFPDELAVRREIAGRYSTTLEASVSVPLIPKDVESAWAQYTIVIDNRDTVAQRLADEGVPSAVYYPCPLHRQPAYAHYPRAAAELPVADRLCAGVLSLPIHPYLTKEAQDRVISAVLKSTSHC